MWLVLICYDMFCSWWKVSSVFLKMPLRVGCFLCDQYIHTCLLQKSFAFSRFNLKSLKSNNKYSVWSCKCTQLYILKHGQSVHVCLLAFPSVTATAGLLTLSFLILAGNECQQLWVVKLLLVAVPEYSGRREDRESLCHISMAWVVKRSLRMPIIAQTEMRSLLWMQQHDLIIKIRETNIKTDYSCLFISKVEQWGT